MRGELVMVDTNILLSATNTGRMDHEVSYRIFSVAWDMGMHLATWGQILREYLVAVTRPVAVNGLGLDLDTALQPGSSCSQNLYRPVTHCHRRLERPS
jgi:hypothetical protein